MSLDVHWRWLTLLLRTQMKMDCLRSREARIANQDQLRAYCCRRRCLMND